MHREWATIKILILSGLTEIISLTNPQSFIGKSTIVIAKVLYRVIVRASYFFSIAILEKMLYRE